MTLDPPSGPGTGPGADTGGGSASEGGTLVFISDASAEAERLSAALRARGYALYDVPLGLLVSRVAVQRPALVICDADAPGAIETVQRVREVGGGQRIDVIFLGEPGRTLEQQSEALEREASGTFARPVDPDILTRKVEMLIGAPSMARTPSANRSPVLVAATRRPYRFEAPASFRPPVPASPLPPDSLGPASSPTTTGHPPSSVPPPSIGTAPVAASIAQARLSPELEMLLGRAEARVRQVNQTAHPLDRLSPEAELDAILPPDLLAALDEPLEVDDDDDDKEESGSGTAGGSEAGSHRTGHGSAGAGTGTGGANARAETNAGGSRPPHGEAIPEPPPAPEHDEPIEEAPITPPALRARHAPPASLRTALEPFDARDNTNAPTAPPPAQPSEPPSLGTGHGMPALSEPPEPSSPEVSTKPPRPDRELEESLPPSMPSGDAKLEVPAVVGVGDAVTALARAVRARFSGAIAFEDAGGIRRVVFRDGDFVTAASGASGESLVEFLAQRGDLSQDTVAKLGRKLPQFGRHAGAALIAQGHLRQDELWNVLRAHAEWIIARVAGIDRGGASAEHDIPARLAAEPGVFGGATGAEVLLDVVRRVVSADEALRRLGGGNVRLVAGPSQTLLGECALSPQETEWVSDAQAVSAGDSVQRAGTRDFATVLYVLNALGVLSASSTPPRPAPRTTRAEPIVPDVLDDAALRSRIALRRALVDEGDYFALLGVSREATGYDVKRAYGELRREFEPGRVLTAGTADLRDDVELIVEVLQEAYDILADDLRRERYRRALDAAPH
ncbi:MAG TPA: hypothetical protein VM686_09775 [Polyangiaceae bacterium]|nr:hypothetical protein [Polyangiaceae bacterium]